jgi:hypothetical protein
MRKVQLMTLNSCQGNVRYAWIQFTTATDVTILLRAIAWHADAELRYRAPNPCDVRE